VRCDALVDVVAPAEDEDEDEAEEEAEEEAEDEEDEKDEDNADEVDESEVCSVMTEAETVDAVRDTEGCGTRGGGGGGRSEAAGGSTGTFTRVTPAHLK
jgi:hypothetical protein